jgi:putative FmdB family regulatory protein
MPVYEYLCKGCGHEFEREQRISEAPIKKCPSCGAQKARRQISRTSFVLKGGGWYSDLYGSSKPPKAAEETGGDKKPAAETPAAASKADAPASKGDAGTGKTEAPAKGGKKSGKGTKSAA